MNTFWLKVAAVAVVVVGSIIAVIALLPEPKPKPKTYYDVIEEDDNRLRADPEPRVEQPPVAGNTVRPEPVRPEPTPQFKELPLEDKVQAEKLFELALFHRKQGRLPGMSYKKMVDYCREIIQRWPESVYAFKARRMLRDIPERYRKLYKITNEEMGL
ncbi:MAG: hypothetical protein ACYSW4_04605 [Planctomycetota bacterium]|jgi:hypothetical protein